jgi:hypothetical protein
LIRGLRGAAGTGGRTLTGFGGTGAAREAGFGFFAACPAVFFAGTFAAAEFSAFLEAAVFLGAAAFLGALFFTGFDGTEGFAGLTAGFFADFDEPEIAEDWAAVLVEAAFFVPALFSMI